MIFDPSVAVRLFFKNGSRYHLHADQWEDLSVRFAKGELGRELVISSELAPCVVDFSEVEMVDLSRRIHRDRNIEVRAYLRNEHKEACTEPGCWCLDGEEEEPWKAD